MDVDVDEGRDEGCAGETVGCRDLLVVLLGERFDTGDATVVQCEEGIAHYRVCTDESSRRYGSEHLVPFRCFISRS